MSELRIIISGGGTGGHIFPAIAIADTIKRLYPAAKILFVGANGRMEMEKIPKAGYDIKGLNIAGFQRDSVLKNLSLPIKILGSLLAARSIVKQFQPHVAVGVGGYASGPLLFAASLLGIPTVIQEQNSFAGITNKLLAKRAKVICTAYTGMETVFPHEKIVITGNPVRAEIATMQCSKEDALHYFRLEKGKKTILILGGSLGARTLNQSVESALEIIEQSDVQILWQTGKVYFEHCKTVAEKTQNLHATMFIDRMDMAYTCADLIISRAGALSISELQIVGKPVILVPSPNVSEDHQTHNANALVRNNAALLMKDEQAKTELISKAIELLKDEAMQEKLSENIKKMAVSNAAERIVQEILKVCKS